MADPVLVTTRDFTSSRYAQLAENAEGVRLSDVLARAEAAIQNRLGRKLVHQSYTETFVASSQRLFVRQRPITAVTSIKRRASLFSGWSLLDLSRIMVEAGPGYIDCYETVRGYQVEVTYTAGYVAVPEDIKEAIIMQAVLLTYQDLEIYGSGDAKQPGIVYMYEDIDRLLAPYKATGSVYH
jgi:hypothetical protein